MRRARRLKYEARLGMPGDTFYHEGKERHGIIVTEAYDIMELLRLDGDPMRDNVP